MYHPRLEENLEKINETTSQIQRNIVRYKTTENIHERNNILEAQYRLLANLREVSEESIELMNADPVMVAYLEELGIDLKNFSDRIKEKLSITESLIEEIADSNSEA